MLIYQQYQEKDNPSVSSNDVPASKKVTIGKNVEACAPKNTSGAKLHSTAKNCTASSAPAPAALGDECPHCYCSPCITAYPQAWLGEERTGISGELKADLAYGGMKDIWPARSSFWKCINRQ